MCKFGVNREAKDSHDYTALHFAARFGHESTVQLLVNDLHVNKEAKDDLGKRALDVARELYASQSLPFAREIVC